MVLRHAVVEGVVKFLSSRWFLNIISGEHIGVCSSVVGRGMDLNSFCLWSHSDKAALVERGLRVLLKRMTHVWWPSEARRICLEGSALLSGFLKLLSNLVVGV